jgi:ADP-ribosyl-[dinitrogen reductase] hydrolase
MHNLSDRVRGCIIGGAVGDARGGPFEGQRGPVQFRESARWAISDESQLTLATCQAIIEAGRVSPEHIADRFLQWYRMRRITGVGASTLKALRDLDAGQHWALAGAKGERAAGNGAAMRIAPLAFCLDTKDEDDRRLLRDVCRITHQNEEAYVGALAVVTAIRSLAFGHSTPTDLLEAVLSNLPDSRVRDRINELNTLSESIAGVAAKFGSSGYVAESVPLSLYAARFIARYQFDEILRMVIEAGGDTDTNASMTGQLLGTWIGASQIPERLIHSLPNVQDIERIASDFAAMLEEQPTENLFSYGTLQLEEVQLETFGRKLDGKPDALPGYRLVSITIADEDFVAKSGTANHRNLEFTGHVTDLVEGSVLKVTQKELEQADAYEPEGYVRVRVQLRSGTSAWVFVAK